MGQKANQNPIIYFLFPILFTRKRSFSTTMTVLIGDNNIIIMSEDRKMYKCTCADCGKDSEVPFEPKPDRPVYCKECLPKHRK
ncbi:hypothetical protein NSED_07345 [Candidatus Nitrosopumilus sediminis]|uniref:CxxC-x17-CxxC domain-containing protein n=1 Tax=Candidatus Nitrosopumilus sediminis TaxID=1229909 RepID=K0BAP0_9ARCH|nr:hypothetical protein NSED_07345 [Candidatus Nitrosopumilus sediminis]